jgi:hypothetical protein
MSNSSNHGMHSFEGKNVLCTIQSFEAESFGRFGRMFRTLPSLYCSPKSLSGLGKKLGPMDGGSVPKFTNAVPLGMIFFGQFIDHDITFDTTTSFSQINNPNQITNTRSAQLDLDCVFGGGPEDEPFMYAPRSEGFFLLTGKTNNNIGQGQNTEKHDLPRNGKGTAIIGDPRNDENRVISQLQLAFIRFYNFIYKDIRTKNALLPQMSQITPEQIYQEARKMVTWHYQWIIVNEYLPTICGKSVVDDILGNGRKFYKPCNHSFIPVEFSVAAYRFGHTMIAQNLKLKQGGASHSIFSPEFGQGFAKITNLNQVIDWDVLFDFDGNYQRAEKLDTTLASVLLDLSFVPSMNPDDKSLAVRNLRRGQSFLLPSGENVAECMGRPKTEIESIKSHINTLITPHNIDLSSGTPLWYYILAEAEVIGKMQDATTTIPGEGLGPVGARIVAEVILGLLELDENSFMGSNRDWRPTLNGNNDFLMKDLLTQSLSGIDL